MDLQCIAQQVSDYLLVQLPNAEGADKETIYEHIARHMLHPRVRIAVTLRQLLDFLSLLQTTLVINDGGACTVDKSNADLYLKVIEKVLALYKVDTTGMMFDEDGKSSTSTAVSVSNGQGKVEPHSSSNNSNNS